MNREFELQVESAKNEVREAGRVQVMCFRFYSAGLRSDFIENSTLLSPGELPENSQRRCL